MNWRPVGAGSSGDTIPNSEKLSMLSPELATLPGSFAPPESENGHPEPPIYPERMCVAKAFRRELAVTPLIRPRRRAAESAPWPCYGTARRDEAYRLPREATARALWALRFVGYLGTVPESDDPYLVFTNAIEEPVGLDVDFAVGKLRKLHDDRTRLGETREPPQRFCRLLLEPPARGAVVSPDRFDSGKKLHPGRWSEKNVHVQPSDKRASASASTCSRECPTPAAISFSPRASKSRSSRSASDRS